MEDRPQASSSNGDAAASLWAAMDAASNTTAESIEADAVGLDETVVSGTVDAPSSTGDPWRLKFLHRVGIQDGTRGSPCDDPLAESLLKIDSDGDLAAEPVVVTTVAPPRTSDTIRAGCAITLTLVGAA